jgi:ubiquinone/menaquinone biosynthesis C-methylase UbiE
MDEQKARIIGLYDRCAPLYDQIGPRTSARFGERLVELLAIEPGAVVLDVATGRGANLFAAAKRAGPTGRVVGVDLSLRMLQETADEVTSRGLANVTLQQMDAEALTLPDATFDYVLCGYAIFWFPNPQQALAEFFRVLRPDGRVGITLAAGRDPRWTWYDELLQAYDDRHHNILVDYGLEGGRRDVDTLHDRIAAAGFAQVETITESFEFVFASAEEWWAARWSHGSRSPLEQMPPAVLDQFQQEVFDQLAQQAEPDGYTMAWPTHFVLATKSIAA